MSGYARNAGWSLSKPKGATRWCAATVVSAYASDVARPSMVMSISGRPFKHPVFLLYFLFHIYINIYMYGRNSGYLCHTLYVHDIFSKYDTNPSFLLSK
jgi:hypothetical protein